MARDYHAVPRFRGGVLLDEQAAPATPGSGLVAVYAKTDKGLYLKDSDGLETPLLERTKRMPLLLPGIPTDGTGTGNNPATSRRIVNSGTQTTDAPKATYDVLDFDGTTDEHRQWVLLMPGDYVSGGTIRLKFANSTTTSGNVIWKAAVAQATDSSTDIDSVNSAYDTLALSAATAAPTTIGHVTEATIALTGGYTANRLSNLMLGRRAGHANDTLNAIDAVLVGATFEYRIS